MSSPSPQVTYSDRHTTTTMAYTVSTIDPSSPLDDLPSGGSCHMWMVVATVIEDDDLTFGGKPLSAWYEEDRRQSMGSDEGDADADAHEEARRGRQRERPRREPSVRHHQYVKGGAKDGKQ